MIKGKILLYTYSMSVLSAIAFAFQYYMIICDIYTNLFLLKFCNLYTFNLFIYLQSMYLIAVIEHTFVCCCLYCSKRYFIKYMDILLHYLQFYCCLSFIYNKVNMRN